jgi:hypothetical protein
MKKEEEKAKELDLFEDFTELHWVKWTRRRPEWNGSIIARWNGKFISDATVFGGVLLSLDGHRTEVRFEGAAAPVPSYTEEQLAILEDLYWLEEKVDGEAYDRWRTTGEAAAPGWKKLSEAGPPEKPGLRRSEQVPCLVVKKGRRHVEMLQWNCECDSWDDADGDDHACVKDQVEWYAVIEGPFR